MVPTDTRAVTARLTPSLLTSDGEFVHPGCEVGPRERGALLTEQRIRERCASIAGGAVAEQKSDLEVFDCGKWIGRCGGKEFEGHGGCVVWDAVEVRIGFGEVREAEEGLEAAVGAKLDVEGGFLAAAGDCCIDGLDDLGGEGGAGDGADGVGCVICEGEFVGVGQGPELVHSGIGDEGGGRDGGVVDFGDIEIIED